MNTRRAGNGDEGERRDSNRTAPAGEAQGGAVSSAPSLAGNNNARPCECGCGRPVWGGWVGMGHKTRKRFATDKCADLVRRGVLERRA